MTDAIIKTMLEKVFKHGIVPVTKVILSMIVHLLKTHPTISAGMIIGMLFGNWIAGVVSWIPLFGMFLGSLTVMTSTFFGGYVTYQIIKKGEKNGN